VLAKKQILIRLSEEAKKAIIREAKKEKKSIAQYMRDAHFSHCAYKYNQSISCPHCNIENQRKIIECWNCKKKY